MVEATNRVHGLGLTEDEFWSMTPREYHAHVSLLDRSERANARLLAAIHNGPMVRKDEQMWTSEMFMPGYEEAKPSAESQTITYRTLKGALGKKKKMTAADMEAQRQIMIRMKRAQEAAEAGKGPDVVNAIMRGVA